MKCGHDVTFSVPRKKTLSDNSGTSQRGKGDGSSGLEVYLEFVVVGEAIKVIAVDADTGVEVSTMGSIRSSRTELESVAINKLRYVLGLQDADQETASDVDKSARDGGKGWVV